MVPIIIDWLAGMYYVAPVAGPYLKDVNGVTITLGATVKLVGVVTAINTDPHFGSITVAPSHPTGSFIPSQSGGGNPQSPNFQVPNQNKPVQVYGFEGLQLVVGS